MKLRSILFFLLVEALGFALGAGKMARAAATPFEFADGDRIALVGNEFFEHEIDDGYIETQLTTRFPDKHLTFRNLGYAGDTVLGNARSLCSGWDNFGPEDQGFNRLQVLIEHLKPTVIFVAYGMNESFEGEKGLQKFQQGLGRMLDMLTAASKARLVLISPTRHEAIPNLADPTEHNRNLGLYVAAIASAAGQRNVRFIDLFTTPSEPASTVPIEPLTFDGIRLTPYGYWRAALAIEQGLGYSPRGWHVEMDAAGKTGAVVGTKLSDIKTGDGISFTAADELLPTPTPPLAAAAIQADIKFLETSAPRIFKITGLAEGSYSLTSVNSKAGYFPTVATAQQWGEGVELTHGRAQSDLLLLRHTIHAKNLNWFNYWRPENDTYLLGFRKHEQGRNSVELPQFEALATSLDAKIAELNHGAVGDYRLSPAK